MSFIFNLFTILVYQPFFNLLVFLYWLLGIGPGQADMGIAVIILTLIIRFLLLPLSIAGMRGEPKKRELAEKVKELQVTFAHDKIRFREERKKMLRKERRVVASEFFSLAVQTIVILMLYRVFKTGLEGKDFHLIYSFMPKVKQPLNLMFLGKYDLSKPSITLNIVQSLMIFIFETVSAITSPFPHTRNEIIRLQFTLPIVSFLIFMFLPAGKKLFVITTLVVSTVLVILKYIRRRFVEYREDREQPEPEVEQIVVETK